MFDYIRVAAVTPKVSVGNVEANTERIKKAILDARAQKADVVLFPELSLSGYTCGDLFFQSSLQNAVYRGILEITDFSRENAELLFVGAQICVRSQIYNSAIVISDGVIRGIVPKTFLGNYGEFSESRWFASATDLCDSSVSSLLFGCKDEYEIPIGNKLIFCTGDGARIGCEICEDLWAPISPAAYLALNGAELIVNLSASDETLAKGNNRRNNVLSQSSKLCCGYAFVSAGASESTTDLVFSGHSIIAERGKLLAESPDCVIEEFMTVSDVDLGRIRGDRGRRNTFRDTATMYAADTVISEIQCGTATLKGDGSIYPLRKLPFIPDDKTELSRRCEKIFDIQAAALKKRLEITGASAVIGISGGLDSTLALLVACEATKRIGKKASDVIGITMPCFGTSSRTYNNSLELMKLLGVTSLEINIKESVKLHFADIGHDGTCHDLTYENAQARERAQVLMDYAGKVGGLVVGTGDLSELTLGWCTYNADHMSMYGVNGDVPKTLIRHIIKTQLDKGNFAQARDVLLDILDTPISPELLPPDNEGKIAQQTEELVGPYQLHDFYLYYVLRYGFSPSKIYDMAKRAFMDEYDEQTLKKWLKTFYRRFFSQQYKRSCQPDGVKVGSVGISPRGDLKLPSDAASALWLEESEKL